MPKDYPVQAFPTTVSWEQWLAKNHEKAAGIWIAFAKKNSGIASVSYAEALDVALCYGWIDSLAKSVDDKTYIQKFTPRKKKSLWSKRNRDHIQRLLDTGRMMSSGIAEVDAAKLDGRWEAAYDAPTEMKMPVDFMKELGQDKKALEFFNSLNKTNRYAIGWKLQTAKKPETRIRRMKSILAMLSRGEKLH